MPRPRTRFAGIAAAAIAVVTLAGCSLLEQQVAVSPTPTPTPFTGASAHPPWVENLTFTGDVKGTMNQVAVGSGGLRTICTGQRGQGGDIWVLTRFGPVGPSTYGLQLTLSD